MPWPKVILEELGLWPVWIANDAVVNAAASAVTEDDTEASPTVVLGEEEPLPWNIPSEVLLTGASPLTTRAPAFDKTPVVPVQREATPAPDECESNHWVTDRPLDNVPMWLDSNSDGDGDVAADVALKLSNVETLDWDALPERVSNCRLCRLCEKRTQTVFGVGDREADWLLVGEAPGQQEDWQGEPFVGQAGKLLDNMLRATALQRGENVYITNVLKCRPPNNRDPEPDEVVSCEPYLKRQIALLKPRVIVVMGRFAAQSILRTQASIASLRGQVYIYEGVPVIVTYHPAYLLRRLPDKAKAWKDWCLAKATYEMVCEMSPNDKSTAN